MRAKKTLKPQGPQEYPRGIKGSRALGKPQLQEEDHFMKDLGVFHKPVVGRTADFHVTNPRAHKLTGGGRDDAQVHRRANGERLRPRRNRGLLVEFDEKGASREHLSPPLSPRESSYHGSAVWRSKKDYPPNGVGLRGEKAPGSQSPHRMGNHIDLGGAGLGLKECNGVSDLFSMTGITPHRVFERQSDHLVCRPPGVHEE